MSLSAVEDDVGVRTGDWLDGSRDEGDDVPSLESLFFLEDLPASLPRASCWRSEACQQSAPARCCNGDARASQ